MAWTTPITWVTGAVTVAQFNTHIRDNENWLKAALTQLNVTSDVAKAKITPALVGARVYKAAAQSIPDNTSTVLTFDTERFDSDAFHDNAVNTSRLTIPVGMGGYYLFGANIEWTSNATGRRQLLIATAGGAVGLIGDIRTAASGVVTRQSATGLYLLAAGDYIEAYVIQTSTVSLDVTANPAMSPEFWLHRLSAS